MELKGAMEVSVLFILQFGEKVGMICELMTTVLVLLVKL